MFIVQNKQKDGSRIFQTKNSACFLMIFETNVSLNKLTLESF